MPWSTRTSKILSNSVGYFCIFLFFVLTIYIVYVFYTSIAPSVLKKEEYGKFAFNIVFGNWIAINLYFNYIMAWLTSPGLAKKYQSLASQYPLCKKCSCHKPPRTHHCKWCDLCILKFDHHCPWLNNCIGFYNHRYFFQFCCFMSGGCLYAGTFGYHEYQIALLDAHVFHYLDSFLHPFELLDTLGIAGFITYFIFVAAITLSILIVFIIWWHGRMIGKGVTSLERVLNNDYAQQSHEQGFIFVNPYDFGWIENWRRFFGVRTVPEFIRRVLLPSTHTPDGDGITWDGFNVNVNLQRQQEDAHGIKRPIAYPPSFRSNSSDTHSSYGSRPIIPPWEEQPKRTSPSQSYQPKSSHTQLVESQKDL